MVNQCYWASFEFRFVSCDFVFIPLQCVLSIHFRALDIFYCCRFEFCWHKSVYQGIWQFYNQLLLWPLKCLANHLRVSNFTLENSCDFNDPICSISSGRWDIDFFSKQNSFLRINLELVKKITKCVLRQNTISYQYRYELKFNHL